VPLPAVYAGIMVDNPVVKRFDYVVALDTEYVAWEDAKGPFNWQLSAQYAVIHNGPPVADGQFRAVRRMSVRVRLCQRPRIQGVIFVTYQK
jgi:hypothetical protein